MIHSYASLLLLAAAGAQKPLLSIEIDDGAGSFRIAREFDGLGEGAVAALQHTSRVVIQFDTDEQARASYDDVVAQRAILKEEGTYIEPTILLAFPSGQLLRTEIQSSS